MPRRKNNKTDKRKYYALIFGVLIVTLLASSSMLQSTYALNENWSLKMDISGIKINSEYVWPGVSLNSRGSIEEGFDYVKLSADDVGPEIPIVSSTVNRLETGLPAIGVSLGSFSQPTAVIYDQMIPGSKIYTWSFSGIISVQTFAEITSVDVYSLNVGETSVTTTEVAELGQADIEVSVDFTIVAGENAKGSCVFEDVSVAGSQYLVDTYGVAADYGYVSSFKVPMINTLEATSSRLDNKITVTVSNLIAASAEIFEGDMILYNAYSEFPVSFEVVQVVSELDDARFGVPAVLNFLPTSAEAFIADPGYLLLLVIVVVAIIVVFSLAYRLYGKP